METNTVAEDADSTKVVLGSPNPTQIAETMPNKTLLSHVFPFISLPREIRDIIYELCADWNDATAALARMQICVENCRLQYWSGKRKFMFEERPVLPSLSTPTIFLLNRQVSKEAREILEKKVLLWNPQGRDPEGCYLPDPVSTYLFTADCITYKIVASAPKIEIRWDQGNASGNLSDWGPWLHNLYKAIEALGVESTDSFIHMFIEDKVEELWFYSEENDHQCHCGLYKDCILYDSPGHSRTWNPAKILARIGKYRRVTLSTPELSEPFGYGISWSPRCGTSALKWVERPLPGYLGSDAVKRKWLNWTVDDWNFDRLG